MPTGELHTVMDMETAINANSCTNNPLPSLAVFCDTHSAPDSTALVRMQVWTRRLAIIVP